MVAALPSQRIVLDGEVLAVGDGRPAADLPGDRLPHHDPAGQPTPAQVRPDTAVAVLLRPAARRRPRPAGRAAVRADRGDGCGPARSNWWSGGRVVDTADEVDDVFAAAVADGFEGVVVKKLDAPYAAGRRDSGWVKLKPRHTFDLAVIAAEWGYGRREGWLSNLHLAARDPAPASWSCWARRSRD